MWACGPVARPSLVPGQGSHGAGAACSGPVCRGRGAGLSLLLLFHRAGEARGLLVLHWGGGSEGGGLKVTPQPSSPAGWPRSSCGHAAHAPEAHWGPALTSLWSPRLGVCCV